MDNIQLGTAIAAPTGTGELYTAFSSDANSAVFKELTSGNLISVKRTPPKPSGASLGVERAEVKITRFVTVADVVHSVICTFSVSIPVAVGGTARDEAWLQSVLVVRNALFSDIIEYAKIPL